MGRVSSMLSLGFLKKLNPESERDIVRLVYKMLMVFGSASIAASLISLILTEFSYFFYALTSGLILLSLGSIGLDLLEVLGYIRPHQETREERKQRLWEEYQEAIRPPRDA